KKAVGEISKNGSLAFAARNHRSRERKRAVAAGQTPYATGPALPPPPLPRPPGTPPAPRTCRHRHAQRRRPRRESQRQVFTRFPRQRRTRRRRHVHGEQRTEQDRERLQDGIVLKDRGGRLPCRPPGLVGFLGISSSWLDVGLRGYW